MGAHLIRRDGEGCAGPLRGFEQARAQLGRQMRNVAGHDEQPGRTHRAQGGRVVYVDEGRIVAAEGSWREGIPLRDRVWLDMDLVP